ncbi:MAG: radical SAM protein [Muribaculaceae bacterium]|nr:radical SAM protein [Muribaculaceae bacterium]
MHFSSDINRPPYEANDAYLQVTSGCSHGTCDFCTFYKDARFRVSPIEEIEADILELKSYGPRYNRIFLQGADPLILPYKRLKEIAELIHKHLPWVTSIGGYARIDNLKNKTVEQLRELKEMGYGGFYFGIESGDDALLSRMHKGYTSEEVVTQMSKLREAGMDFVGNFLGGLGGHNYGLSHARETARVSNIIRPDMIYASELTLFPDTPLMKDVKEGKFEEATEVERFEEMQEFLRCLTIPTVFKAEHVTMPSPIRGRLPEDRDRMIQELQDLIDLGEERLRSYRDQVYGL